MTDNPDPPPLPDWVEKMMPGHAEARQAMAGEYEASPRPGLPRPDQAPEASGTPAPGVTPGDGSPLEMGPSVVGMTPVKSTNIASVGHDGQSLWVKFLNGTLYRYPTAGADLHAGMVAAKSAGQYFHQYIKSAHKGEKVA
jgi:hypothetical protein